MSSIDTEKSRPQARNTQTGARLQSKLGRWGRAAVFHASRKAQARNRIDVCILEHHLLAARFLFDRLKHESRFRLIGQQSLPGTARTLKDSPVIFVIDHRTLPLPLGDCLSTLDVAFPQGKPIILDKELPEDEAVRMLFLGVRGLVNYERVCEDLEAAIFRVSEGGIWASEAALQKYADFSLTLTRAKKGQRRTLTRREVELLELLRRRLSFKAIAELLAVSERKVSLQLGKVFSKLVTPGSSP